jgi:SAM-dependent methyltransferase
MGYEIKKTKKRYKKEVGIYIKNGRIPWNLGYTNYRDQFIESTLNNKDSLNIFNKRKPLKPGFGVHLDERCIEYPWLFSNINQSANNFLDAGSTLNYEYLIKRDFWKHKNLTIFTLAPEKSCYWYLGHSYHFGDLRALPFKDGYFDEIICISTIEHIGMDNSLYAPHENIFNKNNIDFKIAIKDLRRVLKKNGRLFISVPYGRYKNFGIFQQFDENLLKELIDTFKPVDCIDTYYQYTNDGWQISNPEECRDCCYSKYTLFLNNIGEKIKYDNQPAGAEAVACCILKK